MTRAFCLAVLAILVAGCTQAIPMKSAQTGQVAQCGPYLLIIPTNAAREAECVQDFRRQGYERMP
jgi:hypothetical protein